MKLFYSIIFFLLALGGSTPLWSAAAATAPDQDIPEIPVAKRIYRQNPPKTYEEVMEAVETIAESRIAYNTQLKDYLMAVDISSRDKNKFVARLFSLSEHTIHMPTFLSQCDEDIRRWQDIKDYPDAFKFLSVIEPLWFDREQEKISRKQCRAIDPDVRESIYLTECYLYLKSLYDFNFSLKDEVKNGMLPPSYFRNLKKYLLKDFREQETFIEGFQNTLSPELQKKFSFLKSRLSDFDVVMTDAVEKYEKISRNLRGMETRVFLSQAIPTRQRKMQEAFAPINKCFPSCVQKLDVFQKVCSIFLDELLEFKTQELSHSLQKREPAKEETSAQPVGEKIELTVKTSEEEVPVKLETKEEAQEVLSPALAEEEEVSYPQTREDWQTLNAQFAEMKAHMMPQAPAAWAEEGNRFDAKTVEAIESFVQEFVKAQAFKYEDMRAIFNLLGMAPQPHGHNNLCVHIPKRVGNGFIVRFYDKPHGPNEGHNAFWRWAFKDGFQEAGWIQK